ncbi:hypothetical protein EG829_23605 [bacterium]|nr:hypothetical protein [bacterium]
MKTFELTSQTGTSTVTAPSWSDLQIPADTQKVEAVDRKLVMRDMRIGNVELAKLGREYLEGAELNARVNAVLAGAGFEQLLDDVTTFGELRSYPVGRGVFVTITTYRMPSGRYEFVGYLS